MSLLSLLGINKIEQGKGGHTLCEDIFHVVGVSYCIDHVMKLATCNPEWEKNGRSILAQGGAGKKIYRYCFINKPVKILPEPNNSHDRDALLVQIAGEKIGYISRQDNINVKRILGKNSVKFTSAFISGGQYKVVSKNGETIKTDCDISITVKIGYT
ncbi:MAG: HIRAN domain-containing protein [Oscillospiraceae bacterium]|nr:HIRAN domain-containing protein [Oscillospiraceae bacterium]